MAATDASLAAAEADPRRIPVPTSRCITLVDGFGWQDPPIAVEAGRYDLGVRGNTVEAHELVRAAVADRIVDDGGVPAPRNLSLHLADEVDGEDRGGRRDLHRLYLGHHLALRTADVRRLLLGLDGFVDAHAVTHDDELLQLSGVAAVRDGHAHLLPWGYRLTAVRRERRLRDAGFLLVDRPWVGVDLDEGVVVVPPPTIDVDALVRASDGDGVDAVVAPGRYPIAGLGDRHEATPGRVVLDVARSALNLGDVRRRDALDRVAALVDRTDDSEALLVAMQVRGVDDV